MPVPNAKVEIRFDGSTWVDVSSYVDPQAGISIKRGRENETDDPMSVGTCSLVLRNDDGRFSPGLSSSPHYPYVVQGVAVKVSAYAGGAWRVRFYGTVQNWSVQWLNALGTEAITTVTCNDSFGAFPQYELRQAADEVVRALPEAVLHLPLRDADAPVLALIGAPTITATVPTAGGFGAGAVPLTMEEGTDAHPSFTSGAGGLQITVTDVPGAGGYEWRIRYVLHSRPTGTSCDLLKINGVSGPLYLGWSATLSLAFSATAGNSAATVGLALPTAYPIVVEVSRSGGLITVSYADASGTVTSGSSPAGYAYRAPSSVMVNPTLSGGSTWSLSHLTVLTGLGDATALGDFAKAILGSRIPVAVSAVTMLQGFTQGPTIAGTTVGETSLPVLEGRDSADAVGAIAAGMGARISDNFDGTLQWEAFPPSGSVIALPSGEIDPSVTWETSDIGWASDATVTWPDGTSYTATRPDGRRQSVAVEGVHATRSKDRSYADWLVWNTASTGSPRLQQAPYDLGTMADADAVTICSVNVGSRVSLTGLPSQMPTSLLLVVEGIEESITDAQWLVTFKTSPDIYSRLFILDDPVQGVLDAGYLLAP